MWLFGFWVVLLVLGWFGVGGGLRISRRKQARVVEEFRLVGVHCVSCKRVLERELSGLEGVGRVEVDVGGRVLRVEVERPTVKGEVLRAVRGLGYDFEVETLVLRVRGAPRGWRSWVSGELLRLPGVVGVEADYGGSVLRVTYDPGRIGPERLVEALQGLGVKVERVSLEAWRGRGPPVLPGVALLLLALGRLLGVEAFGPAAAVLALVEATRSWAGPSLRALRRGYIVTDLLLYLGVLSGLAASLLGALTGGGTYWEAPVMIVAFVSLGRILEEWARGRATRLLETGRSLPRRARALLGGVWREVEESRLEPGTLVLVRAGETVPVDGRVERGEAEVAASILTGEARPRRVAPGSLVLAGMTVASGSLIIRTLRTGRYRLVERLASAGRAAVLARSGLQEVADRVVAVFVPLVLAVAAATLLAWLAQGAPAQEALLRAATVLVVACPCALGIAVPAASAAAVVAAFRAGALLSRPGALEDLALARAIVLDKTGTLTLGKPRVVEARVMRVEALPLAHALARASHHPAARAVAEYLSGQGVEPGRLEWATEVPGMGVYGSTPEGEQCLLGSPWAALESVGEEDRGLVEQLEERGYTVFATLNGRLIAAFRLEDPLRPGARGAIRELERLGLTVYIATGDTRARALAVAERLGIPTGRVHAGLTPEEKAGLIRRLQGEHGKVAYAGDGINDLPAMAAADASIAVETALDAAKSAGDIIVVEGGITVIPRLVRLARRARLVVRLNLLWAFAYNTLMIPAAAGALQWAGVSLTPALAAAAMSASSVLTAVTSTMLPLLGAKDRKK